jgi:hypothetical protein
MRYSMRAGMRKKNIKKPLRQAFLAKAFSISMKLDKGPIAAPPHRDRVSTNTPKALNQAGFSPFYDSLLISEPLIESSP